MRSAKKLGDGIGVSRSCKLFGVSRMTEYRSRHSKATGRPKVPHPRALSSDERSRVLAMLSSEEYVDSSPAAAYAALLEQSSYLCSVSTMYRILRTHRAVRERRQIRCHPTYQAPQLLAERPNEVWTWDITKLLGCSKFEYFHLYVMLDLYSRRVIGWMVAERESGTLASEFIRDCCARESILPGSLTIHSDRGTSMMSKPVVNLLASLDVHKTVSRPHVSNDNPYSEAHFKTMKYRPSFPRQFGSIQDVRLTLEPFFRWYNTKHRHSGIAYLTPDCVHSGRVEQRQEQRQQALAAAYAATPQRFVRGLPRPLPVPTSVWINPPKPIAEDVALINQDAGLETKKGGLTHDSNAA